MNKIDSNNTGSAFFWVFSGQIARQLSTFIIGVILARLLSPEEFGVIATANIFIAITYAFVDSGFASALIQKKNCTSIDYSTVFYFNLIVSLFFYGLIYFFSSYIAFFFEKKDLTVIIRILGLLIILYALSSVQITILKKELNFKVQTKILIIASIISGLVGVIFAYLGYGVWSLVVQAILNQVIMVYFYWLKSPWRPKLSFSFLSLRSLFGFGSKLLLSGIIFKIYNNLSSLVIAKFYSLAELGFYNRALRFQQLGSQQISKIIAEVTFPLFSKLQDKQDELLRNIRTSLATSLYFSTPISLSVFLLSKYIIIGIVGVKWQNSIVYLELLSIYGVFYPIAPIFTNVLMALGKSTEFLKLEMFRRILDVVVLLTGAFIGIQEMVMAMIITIIISSVYAYFILNKYIKYSIKNLLYDLKNTGIISISITSSIYLFINIIPDEVNNLIILGSCFFIGLIVFGGTSELIKSKEYLIVKDFILVKLHK